jgi:2-keto-4-pentenoate hydratase/2-oxohepta-3-ene-1,7-dioic acid hydratase in catechol pathway
MKLVTFTHGGATRVGVVSEAHVVDLSKAAPDLPAEMVALLEAGDDAMVKVREAQQAGGSARLPLADVRLEAPIARPPEFLAIGLNYADHVAETGAEKPKFPIFFNKQTSCVTGPSDPIHMPRVSTALDYEGELGFVIGKRCRHVAAERAAEVIVGFCVVNDVSVRDWQFKAQTMTLGKSFDTHGPIGPWIVTSDEVGDPHSLDLRTWVNGELRQDSNTSNLIYDCYQQVETLSTVFTLQPGTVIATGTPGGVGVATRPPKFLVTGDVVRIQIQNVGEIENVVIDEPNPGDA